MAGPRDIGVSVCNVALDGSTPAAQARSEIAEARARATDRSACAGFQLPEQHVISRAACSGPRPSRFAALKNATLDSARRGRHDRSLGQPGASLPWPSTVSGGEA